MGAGIEFRSQSINPDFDLKPHLDLIDFSYLSILKNYNIFNYNLIILNLLFRIIHNTFYTLPLSYIQYQSEFFFKKKKSALLLRVKIRKISK